MREHHLGKGMDHTQWITEEDIKDPEVLPVFPNYKIMVRPVIFKHKTKGGIILPDQVKDDVQYLTTVGRVVCLGEMAYGDEERFPNGPWCQPGDYITYGKHTGNKILYKGVMFVIMNDDQVIMRVEHPRDLDPMFILQG
jgi:co-chaperonin GroES (HSP10)